MSRYTINFAPLTVDGQTSVLIGSQPFDKERLHSLRAEFYTTHAIQRQGDLIVDVPIAKGAKPLGNLQEEVDLAKDQRFLPSLFSASLVKVFSGVRDVLSDHPVSVLGASSRNVAAHPDLPEWIQKRSLLRFDTRRIWSKQSVLGVVVESRLKNLILGSCAELISKGISPLGKYVQIEEPHKDNRLMKNRRLVGKVINIRGDYLLLEDNLEGFDKISMQNAFFEGRREIFEECIKQVLGKDAIRFLKEMEVLEADFHSGPKRKEQIEAALTYLREKAHLEAVPNAHFKVGPLLSSDRVEFPNTELIPKPVLVFDPSGTRKDDWAERGIKKNGPYDQRTFSPKRLNIAVVCQARHEGQVDRFVAKFLDGMPNALSGKNNEARYGDGFLRRFALEKPNLKYFTASTSSTADYASASQHALTQASDEGFKWDLALVQVEEEFKSLNDESNPYYATKSTFLKRDVPVQSVRLETMSQSDGQLVFSMNHMSLATYAKLGGTPWLLASPQTVAHELVIGLGSHSVSASRIGARQRFVGITTVFSSDGSYLLSDRTAVVPFSDYADALCETLTRSITTVRKQDNWRSTDKVRLVFHMFKPAKDAEAEAIERTVKALNLDNVSFAFLHVAPSHPYLIFDSAQEGIGYRDPKKGVLGPARGLHLKLGDKESLVVFSGSTELKQASDGMPRPCLLKLHRLSTFTDMTYLARQAFEFAGHSWRMLAPEPFPITIRYSDLIAERLSGLSGVAGWDAEAVRFGQIGRTLWYL